MKKSDIKNGMHLITNMGEEYVVVSDVYALNQTTTCKMVMVNLSNGWMPLDDYNDDLQLQRHDGDCPYDIKEVYAPQFYANTFNSVRKNHSQFVKLWERPRSKKMTKEEIEAELGYKIEIVDD